MAPVDLPARLLALNLTLPAAPKPVAAYVPVVRWNDLLFVSGQIPLRDGKPLCTGTVPDAVSIEQAQQAAQQCVLNALAIVHAELGGDWSKLVRVVRIAGFVASAPGFAGQSQVLNGASELLEKLLGDAGRHARAAVGSVGLPLNVPVEIEFVFGVR